MILVLNCGSQSIKWKIFNEKMKVVNQGHKEILNSSDFENILKSELGQIGQEVNLIGHRVVHGGGIFTEPLKITDENLQKLEKLNHFAPLHNPYNLLGIKICAEILKGIPQVAVFDTEFFKDLPEFVYTYALPEEIVKENKFRRYGFQGTSHEYVAKIAMKKLSALGGPASGGKIITCHLGGGASVTAIKNGKAVDTSMGFTPMEGLVMMTRSGNVDAKIVLELAKKYSPEKAEEILNKESGIKGICGEGDFLGVLEKVKAGDKNAQLAFDVFVYSIKKYIGAYFAILGGCDVLVFTGSIGSGDPKTRKAICKNLDILKKTKIFAIKTDEEMAIATKISSLRGV